MTDDNLLLFIYLQKNYYTSSAHMQCVLIKIPILMDFIWEFPQLTPSCVDFCLATTQSNAEKLFNDPTIRLSILP